MKKDTTLGQTKEFDAQIQTCLSRWDGRKTRCRRTSRSWASVLSPKSHASSRPSPRPRLCVCWPMAPVMKSMKSAMKSSGMTQSAVYSSVAETTGLKQKQARGVVEVITVRTGLSDLKKFPLCVWTCLTSCENLPTTLVMDCVIRHSSDLPCFQYFFMILKNSTKGDFREPALKKT